MGSDSKRSRLDNILHGGRVHEPFEAGSPLKFLATSLPKCRHLSLRNLHPLQRQPAVSQNGGPQLAKPSTTLELGYILTAAPSPPACLKGPRNDGTFCYVPYTNQILSVMSLSQAAEFRRAHLRWHAPPSSADPVRALPSREGCLKRRCDSFLRKLPSLCLRCVP